MEQQQQQAQQGREREKRIAPVQLPTGASGKNTIAVVISDDDSDVEAGEGGRDGGGGESSRDMQLMALWQQSRLIASRSTAEDSSSRGTNTASNDQKGHTYDHRTTLRTPVASQSTSSTSSSSSAPPRGFIFAHVRQRQNPVMRLVRHVRVQYVPSSPATGEASNNNGSGGVTGASSILGETYPDFVFSDRSCAVFVTLKFHMARPHILQRKVIALQSGVNRKFTLRVVLCQVDTDDHVADNALLSMNQLCLENHCTLILTFSAAETARYLELYRLSENRSSRTIRTRLEQEYAPRLYDVLTSVRSVNKNDVLTLANNFQSLRGIMQATQGEMVSCPGFGVKKAKRLWDTFHADWSA